MKLQYPFGNHIGEQFGHLLAVSAIETDPETGDPVVYDCKCMKCGKEHVHVLDRDLLSYKARNCGCSDRHDLTGMRFTRLQAIRRVENSAPSPSSPAGHIRYLCKCSCGKEITVYSSALVAGLTCSCGCLQRERAKENVKDLTGKIFGRLTVLRRDIENTTNRKAKWIVQCSCGNGRMFSVPGSALLSGNTRSCGCLKRELSSLNNLKWTDEERMIVRHLAAMKQRCYNTSLPDYIHYGARGIKICAEWLNDSKSFVEWAKKSGYKPGLTIERIDCNGDYEPRNCCWISQEEQTKNMRRNIRITINGVTKILSDWSSFIGISYSLLHSIYHKKGRDECIARISAECKSKGLL